MVSSDVDLEDRGRLPVGSSAELLREVVALVVELEDFGVLDEEVEGAAHERGVVADEDVEDLSV